MFDHPNCQACKQILSISVKTGEASCWGCGSQVSDNYPAVAGWVWDTAGTCYQKPENQIVLQPVNEISLAVADETARLVFPNEVHADGFWPSNTYRWSIEEKDAKFCYYLAVYNNKVVGITGHYSDENDPATTLWLGWFGVVPSARKQGLGQQLLVVSERLIAELGATTLKLYSRDDEVSQSAHRLYQRNGYQQVGNGLVDNLPVKYFEKLLNDETLST